ncbi:uncharacterized protein LOC129956658 [Argiope bruennichi]|uniref:uncharacterized protein LOC129956658 n=1 Tax=Argiope bruennichi TaxID=94029 RepID=UPI0024953849|nr:uncharacterized protein LOC129956658 [Argiope bruennichi]
MYALLTTSSLIYGAENSTVLVGIEASLNSRPLIYESGENDTEEALTPAHFLTGRKLTIVPSGPESRNDKLTNIYRQQQDLLDTFWKRWSKEYLLELRTFHQVRNVKETPRVRVGDLVLLQEDLRPRQMWKKALVVKLIDGRDGRIRTCILRVKGKEITRPIQLVIPLDVDQGGEDVAARKARDNNLERLLTKEDNLVNSFETKTVVVR